MYMIVMHERSYEITYLIVELIENDIYLFNIFRYLFIFTKSFALLKIENW